MQIQNRPTKTEARENAHAKLKGVRIRLVAAVFKHFSFLNKQDPIEFSEALKVLHEKLQRNS